MTAFNFDRALDVILENEGGFVDDERDPGGVTNLGVTQKTWSAYIGRDASMSEMKALTPSLVGPLYKHSYWDICRCDDLPTGIDLFTFDSAVNAGPSKAAKWLQTAVSVTADGSVGPATLAAVEAADADTVIDALAAERDSFYRASPNFGVFGNGWLARVDRVHGLALAWSKE